MGARINLKGPKGVDYRDPPSGSGTPLGEVDLKMKWGSILRRIELFRKVDVRLPGKENSNSRGARPVYQNHLDDLLDSDQQVVNR